MILEVIALVVVSIVFLIGLFMALFGIPFGTFVILGGALLYDLITWSWAVSQKIILVLLGIAVLAELIEFLFSLLGAKVFKMTRWTTVGFIVGLIIGAVVGLPVPILGSVLGMLVGGFLGAFIFSYVEKHNFEKSLKAGIGAFITGLGSIILKFSLAVVMVVVFFVSVLS
jgi:uncharacterized protein YqgC (DUF456 family)